MTALDRDRGGRGIGYQSEGWHMTAYELGQRAGSYTVYLAFALLWVWLFTIRWRDPRPSEVRGSEETARVGRRRTRIVKYTILAVSAVWILTVVLTVMHAAAQAG